MTRVSQRVAIGSRPLANGLYAAGLSVRDIQVHLEDIYGLKVSPDLISRVTDAVLNEVRDWQSRALDRMYPIVIFDALRVKIRSDRGRGRAEGLSRSHHRGLPESDCPDLHRSPDPAFDELLQLEGSQGGCR